MFYWLQKPEILAQQRLLIDRYGGSHGVLNEGALESTLGRPLNLHAYGQVENVFRLAACYGYGFAKNRCFVDGNKRIALTSMDVFLGLHDYELVVEEPEAVATILAIYTNEINEPELAEWIERVAVPLA